MNIVLSAQCAKAQVFVGAHANAQKRKRVPTKKLAPKTKWSTHHHKLRTSISFFISLEYN